MAPSLEHFKPKPLLVEPSGAPGHPKNIKTGKVTYFKSDAAKKRKIDNIEKTKCM